MAKMLQDVLGDLLLTYKIDNDGHNILPSPEQLKRKILVKHKIPVLKGKAKSPESGDGDVVDALDEEEDEEDSPRLSVANIHIKVKL